MTVNTLKTKHIAKLTYSERVALVIYFRGRCGRASIGVAYSMSVTLRLYLSAKEMRRNGWRRRVSNRGSGFTSCGNCGFVAERGCSNRNGYSGSRRIKNDRFNWRKPFRVSAGGRKSTAS